jgi:hypothetical protein
MSAHLALAALSIVALTAHAAAGGAQPLANVSGFDAALLAGRTCQGEFESGRNHPWSNGGVELVFAIEGNRLTAQYSQLLGAEAHDPAEYAMVQDRPIDTSGYEHLGSVREMTVAGDTIRFIDPTGARYVLTYNESALAGQRDPRGGSDPRMTRVTVARLRCR